MPRRRILIGCALLAVLLAGAGAAALLLRSPGDEYNPSVGFTTEGEAPEDRRRSSRADRFVWGTYGLGDDRRRYLPARGLRPPFKRAWKMPGKVLLEFPPAIDGKRLFLLKNNGALVALSKASGKVLWKRKLGALAASSPAVADGRVFVTLLARKGTRKRGRVVALGQKEGNVLWARDLASRSESSPLVSGDSVFFGSEGGSVYRLRAKDGFVRWKYAAGGAVKAGVTLDGGKLYFGTYRGEVHAIRAETGKQVWRKSAGGGGALRGSGSFYSTPAVAYGRVFLGSTDGRVYSFATDSGKLAWAKKTGGFVYGSPAIAGLEGRPTVYIGSYDGRFYALDARNGRARWSFKSGGKISGSATVVGDVVYFSDLGKKRTYGLGARTGKQVWEFGRGAFNPVVSDGRRLFVTGYAQQYAFDKLSQASQRKARRAKVERRKARERRAKRARRAKVERRKARRRAAARRRARR